MTIEERLTALAAYGIGCPRAVELGGPAAVEAWCEQQELEIQAREEQEADAAAVAEVSAEADALAEGKTHVLESILKRLDALEAAVDALAVSGPTEETLGEVAAGGDPEPDGTKAPDIEAPKDTPDADAEPEKAKGKGSKKGGKKT